MSDVAANQTALGVQVAPRPAARLRGLSPYGATGSTPGISLRLDANEGSPASDALMGVMAQLTPDDVRRYSTPSSLEARLAESFGIAPGRIVVTNGGDDAIDRVCRAVVEPGRVAVGHAPSFEMIGRGVRLAGGETREVAWLDGAFPLDAVLAEMDSAVSLVTLVSPNNPTGGVVPIEAIRAVVRRAAEVGALVMLDLAYIEFADDDPTALMIDEPNVVMIRTFSKAFGLAGLRVGYAIASQPVATWLRTVGGPYPVSVPSLAAAGRALELASERSVFIERVREQRGMLRDELNRLGWDAMPSQANFVLARVVDAAGVHRRLAARGVLVRRFADDGPMASMLRITVPGVEAEYDELVAALRAEATEGDADA